MALTLHLDPLFSPYPNLETVSFESFMFSGGEPHIKLLSSVEGQAVHITHRACSWNDLGLIAIASDALRRGGAKSVELTLPYFPGARQDRLMVAGEALTVKVYANFLNQLSLKRVTIFDPHSEVAPALLDTPRVVSNIDFIREVVSHLPEDVILISPDGGALKKIYKVAAALEDYDVVEGGKRRDVKTGQLSGFSVNETDLKGRPCLIVDDICDGGGTFIGLAAELKKANAGALFLAVSHGIFSRGLEDLAEVFSEVFCTDAFNTPALHERLHVVPMVKLLQA
ncbi:MAG: ribose-phosphate diphosphokinase [Saprospiraceae bacterium]